MQTQTYRGDPDRNRWNEVSNEKRHSIGWPLAYPSMYGIFHGLTECSLLMDSTYIFHSMLGDYTLHVFGENIEMEISFSLDSSKIKYGRHKEHKYKRVHSIEPIFPIYLLSRPSTLSFVPLFISIVRALDKAWKEWIGYFQIARMMWPDGRMTL